MTPSGQHPITAARAPDLSGRQPGLDADRIDFYRHHRCLRALQRGAPQAGQDLSGVPRTHQFLVTLTVHTNKINPAMTPSRRSATSMTNRHQVVVIQKDGQQARAESLDSEDVSKLLRRFYGCAERVLFPQAIRQGRRRPSDGAVPS
jgi:hypothetical protein